MATEAPDAGAFMAAVESLVGRAPELSPLDAGLLAALRMGVAGDTRAFARVFGVPHALVLRATSELADEFGLVAVTGRDPRTQRTRLELTDAGARLLEGAPLAA